MTISGHPFANPGSHFLNNNSILKVDPQLNNSSPHLEYGGGGGMDEEESSNSPGLQMTPLQNVGSSAPPVERNGGHGGAIAAVRTQGPQFFGGASSHANAKQAVTDLNQNETETAAGGRGYQGGSVNAEATVATQASADVKPSLAELTATVGATNRSPTHSEPSTSSLASPKPEFT